MTEQGPADRVAIIDLLKAAGFTEHAPRRRRKRDPEPADGFRVFTLPDGSVLAAWVPVGGGDHKKPGQLARSREMAEAYALAADADGWATGIGGLIWHHVCMTKAA